MTRDKERDRDKGAYLEYVQQAPPHFHDRDHDHDHDQTRIQAKLTLTLTLTAIQENCKKARAFARLKTGKTASLLYKADMGGVCG